MIPWPARSRPRWTRWAAAHVPQRGLYLGSTWTPSRGFGIFCSTAPSRAASFATHHRRGVGAGAQEAGDAVARIRNIGIVAHIDAGKTTTTERMLFYSGVTKRVGDVDSGTTTTDFMKEEADRGITIQSAAVSLQWKSCDINLIDTPGHVDFTVEVERAMRVVDGVVALFDASAGVQAQSYTVLQQSRKFQVPLLAFVNKMDKYNADFQMSVASIRDKLQVEPLLLQLPLHGEDGSFAGVVDVLAQTACRFGGQNGSEVQRTNLDEASGADGQRASSPSGGTGAVAHELPHVVRAMRSARHDVVAQLTAVDDTLSEQFIEQLDATDGDEAEAERRLSTWALQAAVRRCVVHPPHGRPPLLPVLCGASRRDQGVQPLLDAITCYLPSPADRHPTGLTRDGIPVALPPASAARTVSTVALAFKVTHAVHPLKGQRLPLVFLRVYSGMITPRAQLANHSRGQTEVVEKLYVMHANQPVEVPCLAAGQIGAAFLTHTYTGDTLFAHPSQHLLQAKARVKKGEVKEEVYTLEGIDAPPAVISFSIEAATRNQVELLKDALAELTREDPSLRVSENEQGTMVVSGMGELHLEIIMSRLSNEYQVKCRLLRAIIEYRETLRTTQAVEKHVGFFNELPYAECSLEMRPLLEDGERCGPNDHCRFRMDNAFVASYLAGYQQQQQQQQRGGMSSGGRANDVRNAKEELRVISTTFQSAVDACMRLGPLAGLPMHGVEVVLTSFRKTAGSVLQGKSLSHVARSVLLDMLRATRKDDLALLEPMMEVEVHLSEPTYIGNVVSSLNEHKALTVDVQEDGRSVKAIVAMRNTLHYTMELRKAVKGHANLFMKLHHYQVLEEKTVISRILKNLGITE
ncbi:putative mitochondrial Mitochondrial elongation factor G [Leptomonas pyrrhocoris]|uniref:Putative mitochondrial Mitochondrial elongation factor G n=1 Tax=Leptomonas pyrrhocoris TaxID=157538 RepID=A0A0M9G9A5_LEPPY|nr:putative mitochondrial Mitochondrial elongation factor G [Leptomonas pyrrhocoris]KPA85246.1 putative mitochondrial Mitochondrial elongation factor G [Leptomonas pyrrhocoris]|eukprot:XP_015663685.1 putative mitochondrial Mitochondrial elongation factor G [Leptomonas pyrrhocoris]